MERRTALLVTVVFAIGMFGGIIVGSIRTKSQHIKTEYFIELKHETVLIEDTEGNIITCPFNDISKALLRDNL